MNSLLKILLLLGGALLAYSGYQDGKNPPDVVIPDPVPTNETTLKIVTDPPEAFPSEPTFKPLKDASEPLYHALINPTFVADREDRQRNSIELARVFREWAWIIRRQPTELQTTAHFQKALNGSLDLLFKNTHLTNRYQGQVGKAIKLSLSASLTRTNPPLAKIDTPALMPGKLTPEAFTYLAEALEVCSYQAFRAFIHNTTQPQIQ